jgi:hypothetical protein
MAAAACLTLAAVHVVIWCKDRAARLSLVFAVMASLVAVFGLFEFSLMRAQTATPPPAEKKRGVRGKIAASKKEAMTDYMKTAVALVKQYVPPEPGLIQKAKDAGKVSVSPQPGQRATLTFSDYLKPGDSFALVLDLGNNRPVEAKVSTYLDSKADAVTLEVKFSTLDNNATYASRTTLNAPTKNLSVSVENSGYRRQ